MLVVTIKARDINRGQKRVLLYQVADADHQAGLNFNKPILELVRVRQSDVVIVGPANREMDRVFKRAGVWTKGGSDESVSGRRQIGGQRHDRRRKNQCAFTGQLLFRLWRRRRTR